MITLIEDNEYTKSFGDEPELEDIDVNDIVDKYLKMGPPPDESYILEAKLKWSVC